MMRIITGTAKGTRLETLEGENTRPTAERVKEAVFSMIQFDIEGRRVLDLFAGSGQLGLEALSRGAANAVFIDSGKDAAELIKRNAQKTKLFSKSVILSADYKSYLRGIKNRERFDIIFLDPPYESDFLDDALEKICEWDILNPHGIIVCESGRAAPLYTENTELLRHAKYGRAYITVLHKPAAEGDE